MIAEEAGPRPSRALVAMPPRPAEPAGLRIGTVIYLVSVGLIAAATTSASFGIGFYLLVHPQQQAAAEPASSSDADPVQAAPPSRGADELRSAVATGSPGADMELGTPDESMIASQPKLTSPTSEASAPIPRAPLSAAALPVQPASSPELEAGLEPLRSEGRVGEDSSSSVQGADHPAVRDIPPDMSTPPEEGEPRDQNRNAGLQEQAGEPSNSAEVVSGIPTDVRDVVTWTIGGRTVRLFGIKPGPRKLLGLLVNWVRAKGSVECLPQAGSLSYRCFTATGEDIAEAALLAGIGRAGEHATAAYESAESSARLMGKGLWARR
jgi:endonuclease YncB( thermonuclease family)